MASVPQEPKASIGTRRHTERVEWTPKSRMTVDVLREGKPDLPACWADLSVSGVMLILPLDKGAGYEVDEQIDLRFRIDDYQFEVAGTLVWTKADDTGKIQSCGVHFQEMPTDMEERHNELWVYFNRRISERMTPLNDEGTEAFLSNDKCRVRVRMVDLSSTGIRIAFDREDEESKLVAAGLGHKYQLELKLSPEHSALRLSARADHETRDEGELRWGLVFIEEDDLSDREARDVISGYVRKHASKSE